jgi:DNA-binding MarR family transcriptional regulator
VRRTQRPEDGRAVSVAITPAGLELTDLAGQEASRQLGVFIDTLTIVERRSLASMATKLVGSAEL